MRETENLSRHEQLRLDYLHTNYYYLNEPDKEEYNYLRQKSKGRSDVAQKPSTKQSLTYGFLISCVARGERRPQYH